jgi:hypothetical protein
MITTYVSPNRVFGESGLAKGGGKVPTTSDEVAGRGVEKFHVCAHSTISRVKITTYVSRNSVFGESGLAKGGGKVPTTSEQVAGRM